MNPADCRNAFCLIRWFFAASLVCFHGCVVAEHTYEWFVAPHAIVSAFFVMSGMLSYNSLLSRTGTKNFYLRRLRKVVPPYALVVICVAAAGIFLTSLGTKEYLTHAATAKYLVANLSFLNFLAPGLPGVFTGNHITAVNSSLWTMKVEVAFYIMLPALLWAVRRMKAAPVIVTLYVLSVAWNLVFDHLWQTTGNASYDMVRRQVFGQMIYFAAGMAAVHLRSAIVQRRYAMLVAGAAAWALCSKCDMLFFVEPVAIAVTLTAAAYADKRLSAVSVHIPNLTYEVYLLHFPVLQTLVTAGFFVRHGFGAGMGVAVCLILLLALLMRKAATAVCARTRA